MNGADLDSSLTGSEMAGLASPKRRKIVWRDKTDLNNMASKGKDIDISKMTAAEAQRLLDYGARDGSNVIDNSYRRNEYAIKLFMWFILDKLKDFIFSMYKMTKF